MRAWQKRNSWTRKDLQGNMVLSSHKTPQERRWETLVEERVSGAFQTEGT